MVMIMSDDERSECTVNIFQQVMMMMTIMMRMTAAIIVIMMNIVNLVVEPTPTGLV